MYKDRRCFVAGCKTGHPSDNNLKIGLKVASVFSAPKDPAIFEQWQKVVPPREKIFSCNNVICALHFREENILRFYETKLADGSIHKIARGRIALKPSSVPSIFPIFGTNSSAKRKLKCDSMHVSNKKSRWEFINIETLETLVNVKTENSLEIENPLTCTAEESKPEICISNIFEQLKPAVTSICFPNKQWSITFIEDQNVILIAQWVENYTPKKRLIIHEDMSYKVYFGNTEIIIENKCVIITSLETLENILKLIDNMKL